MGGMAEMEVSPQEKIANPQGRKVFAVERHRPAENVVYFRALCGVQSSPLVITANRAIVSGSLQWQAPVQTLFFRFAFLLSCVLKLDDQTFVHLISQPT